MIQIALIEVSDSNEVLDKIEWCDMRKTICASLIAASLTLITPSQALAENWIYVASSDSSTRYVDHGTFRRTGPYVQFWSRTIYKTNPNNWIEDRTYEEVNCSQRQKRSLQITFYYKNGTSESTSRPSDWSYVVPGTVGEALLEHVCAKA